ncbi:MAG: LexA family protein, partial [Blastocatellia bacterium]
GTRAANKGKRTNKSKPLSGSAGRAAAARLRPDLKLVGGAPKPKYTSKQGQYLAFIHLYRKLNRRPPAETDLQRYFRTSPPSIHQMVVGLEKNGLIEKIPYQARSIRITVPPEELPDLE